jgi:hypothetical protein
MQRRSFFQSVGMLGLTGLFKSNNVKASANPVISDRAFWVETAVKLAHPMLSALADDALKERMPVEAPDPNSIPDRKNYTYLEGFGRLMCGISPWLALPDDNTPESQLRSKYRQMALKGLSYAVDPKAKSYMNFSNGYQPLVDASFLAYAFVRAPKLWEQVDAQTQQNVINAFLQTRQIKPWFNNWLLFSGMIEAFFLQVGQNYDKMRIDFAVRQHIQWYKGDGMFGDGEEFHWDYYNSYVIQPYLYDILKLAAPKESGYKPILESVTKYAKRFAAIQERLVAPDGTFPVIGRSICYRCGAFQHLANMALLKDLPQELKPAQVRGALTAVIRKTTESPANFDAIGWLQLGLSGHQPHLAESYISTGSLYLCATALLPLGLPASDPFWADAPEDWTSRKVWSGQDFPADHAISK